MAKRTSALAGMRAIAEQFDTTSNTLVRANKHKVPSANDDELLILGK